MFEKLFDLTNASFAFYLSTSMTVYNAIMNSHKHMKGGGMDFSWEDLL